MGNEGLRGKKVYYYFRDKTGHCGAFQNHQKFPIIKPKTCGLGKQMRRKTLGNYLTKFYESEHGFHPPLEIHFPTIQNSWGEKGR